MGTPSVTDHTFGNKKEGLRVSFKLTEILNMFHSQRPTDDDFINGVPIAIAPEGDDQNPNSSWFGQNEDSYTDLKGHMLQKEHVDAVLIDDDDIMVDEWNSEYDPIADVKSITAMYSDAVFTTLSVIYNKEARCASMMTNGLL